MKIRLGVPIVLLLLGVAFLVFVLAMFLLVPDVSVEAREAVETTRPIVPEIQTYGFPPGTLEGQPAECDGDPECGTLCFIINEGGSWYWELSCVPWDYDLGIVPTKNGVGNG